MRSTVLGILALAGVAAGVGVPIAAAAIPSSSPVTVSAPGADYDPNGPAAGANTAGSAEITGVEQAPTPLDLNGDAMRKNMFAAKGERCPVNVTGDGNTAPGTWHDSNEIQGTTTTDLIEFADAMNSIRVQHCLPPIPVDHFVWGECMERRLLWMAEDPSTNPASAWGHIGSKRSDGVPSVGCDGDLAGGSDNSPYTVAQKWWDSISHRQSLYRPSYIGSTSNVCVAFADVHGGVPNDPLTFTRASAIWVDCKEAGVNS